MNSFFQSSLLQRMMPPPMQNMMSFIQQVRQVQQNPSMLSQLLQQRGMISDQQAKEIQKMGTNYEQIGQYLIQNGRMPSNYRQYENQIGQVQSMMQNKENTNMH